MKFSEVAYQDSYLSASENSIAYPLACNCKFDKGVAKRLADRYDNFRDAVMQLTGRLNDMVGTAYPALVADGDKPGIVFSMFVKRDSGSKAKDVGKYRYMQRLEDALSNIYELSGLIMNKRLVIAVTKDDADTVGIENITGIIHEVFDSTDLEIFLMVVDE